MSTSSPTRDLSIAETCERIGRTRWTVGRLIKSGDLVASKRGSAKNAEVRISEDSVNAWLAGHPIETAEPARSTA